MKYLLDFDRTVFDMDSLYEEILRVNPDKTVGTIESLEGIDLKQFLFADAVSFFQNKEKENIEIISSCFGKTAQWDKQYQIEKINRSGVQNFVAAVHVVEKSKVDTIRELTRGNSAVFVDDHPEHVKEVTTQMADVKVLYLDRKNTGVNIDGSSYITTLAELDAIMGV